MECVWGSLDPPRRRGCFTPSVGLLRRRPKPATTAAAAAAAVAAGKKPTTGVGLRGAAAAPSAATLYNQLHRQKGKGGAGGGLRESVDVAGSMLARAPPCASVPAETSDFRAAVAQYVARLYLQMDGVLDDDDDSRRSARGSLAAADPFVMPGFEPSHARGGGDEPAPARRQSRHSIYGVQQRVDALRGSMMLGSSSVARSRSVMRSPSRCGGGVVHGGVAERVVDLRSPPASVENPAALKRASATTPLLHPGAAAAAGGGTKAARAAVLGVEASSPQQAALALEQQAARVLPSLMKTVPVAQEPWGLVLPRLAGSGGGGAPGVAAGSSEVYVVCSERTLARKKRRRRRLHDEAAAAAAAAGSGGGGETPAGGSDGAAAAAAAGDSGKRKKKASVPSEEVEASPAWQAAAMGEVPAPLRAFEAEKAAGEATGR